MKLPFLSVKNQKKLLKLGFSATLCFVKQNTFLPCTCDWLHQPIKRLIRNSLFPCIKCKCL